MSDPLFSSNSEALDFYNRRLEALLPGAKAELFYDADGELCTEVFGVPFSSDILEAVKRIRALNTLIGKGYK